MGCEEEVMRIGKKLDKMVGRKTFDGALDLLKALQGLPITLEILQKTRIGMAVNSVRKASSEDVCTLAKALIKQWKRLLSANAGNAAQQPANYSLPNSASTASLVSLAKEAEDGDSRDSNQNASQNAPQSGQTTTTSLNEGLSLSTGDSVRLKCREMLENALKTEPQPESLAASHEDLAAQIEDFVYQEFRCTDMKYRARIRSRVANLKDPKNPNLKTNILNGVIETQRFATMTAEEMASDELKSLRQKFTKEAINDHQMAVTSNAHRSV